MPSSSPVLASLAWWVSAASLVVPLLAGSGSALAQMALIDGQAISETEVLDKSRVELSRLELNHQRSRHELIQGRLDEMIRGRLLDSEAAARGTTREALLASLTTPVTDEQIEQFYEQNAQQINQPKEQVVEKIRAYLQQQQSADAEKKLVDELRIRHNVRVLFEPFRAPVEAADSPSRGPVDAPLTLIVFADFECPYCQRVVPTLDRVAKSYSSTLRMVFRQFPLSGHAHAQKAAEASLCAHAQGKFWEMYGEMFSGTRQLEVENLKQKAAELGLDRAKFDACLDSGATAAQVGADLKAGMDAGVDGTPSMFINGRFVSGAVDFEQLAAVIDDELKRLSGQ